MPSTSDVAVAVAVAVPVEPPVTNQPPRAKRDTLLSNLLTHVSLRVLEIVLDVGSVVRRILHHQCPITWLGRHPYVSVEQRAEMWRAESGNDVKIVKFLD
jgi:hypothetical protein